MDLHLLFLKSKPIFRSLLKFFNSELLETIVGTSFFDSPKKAEKISKKFEKTLDKQIAMCYNKYRRQGENKTLRNDNNLINAVVLE